MYRNCLKKAKTNPIRNFAEEARNYKIEIVTKIFLLLINVTCGICLVKYLHIVYHEMNIDPFQFIKRFLIVSILMGIFLITTGSVPQLMFIEKLVEPIILFFYLYISVKNNITF